MRMSATLSVKLARMEELVIIFTASSVTAKGLVRNTRLL